MVFGWNKLAKFVAWSVAILTVCGIIWYGVWAIRDAGYDSGFNTSEKAWQLKFIKTQTDEARLRSEISERAAQARIESMRAEENANKERENLNGRLIDMHIAGLWIDTDIGYKGCGNGENADSQIEGGPARRVRLPEQVAEDIFGLTKDAQLVVIQYNNLREIVKSIPCVEIVD